MYSPVILWFRLKSFTFNCKICSEQLLVPLNLTIRGHCGNANVFLQGGKLLLGDFYDTKHMPSYPKVEALSSEMSSENSLRCTL